MRKNGACRTAVAVAVLGTLAVMSVACGSERQGGAGEKGTTGGAAGTRPHIGDRTRTIPDVGDRLQHRIPADSGQVVAVYGEGRDSADSTVVLYGKRGPAWDRMRSWPAHNGKKGWTADHHEGDRRSPIGVFTLTDAGGVLVDPGARIPYTRDASLEAPRWWARSHWHDFDYVIAIDYNRVKGTPPDDPTRPEGDAKGGSIWLHMDHGSGTSACVSVSREAMEYLLRTLDPDRHPVVVMGDRADLKSSYF
ncbi:L,D-transpeptidase family protein [Streptomyces sp. NBC_00201]|uniref:L,D-transpeptidase family protein n=1 Tax=Streptomyces sp. NBC_00201 TaxID=2975679 RepID=UPI00225C06BE|nr:L,D-transpeptidase family protein [Streptomyces sp. NBC_00201]MCX5244103.1 L,D-transpeptidase family protein [Streptomyces sp. NBC_00201]